MKNNKWIVFIWKKEKKMRKTCDMSKEHPYTFNIIWDYLHVELPQKHSLYVNSEVRLHFILFYMFFLNTLMENR